MARVVLAAVLAVLLGACSSGPSDELRPGRYAGSTAGNVAVTVDIAGGLIRVNEKRTRLIEIDDNRAFRVDRTPEQTASFVDRSRWTCTQTHEGEEIACEVTWASGQTEPIELMRE